MVVTIKCSSLLRHVEGHVKKNGIIQRKRCQWVGKNTKKKKESEIRKEIKKEEHVVIEAYCFVREASYL